ncbi:glycine betaine ABC transporter substrate-binding protein OsmF [Halomonas cibimaris]|uniref:Glycine betaine ABC transporter substrate-binding protein OsmF n=1 Tax=Halomonas cibimaris TaxID=657012 RepID=A0ABP7LZP0_9GAMM
MRCSFLKKYAGLAALILAAPVIASPALAASTSDDRAVVIGSKIDTEGAVLGELIVQTLERIDVPVENRLQLGVTSVVRQALLTGEIDLYPEYTGNGAFFFDMTASPVWQKPQQAWQTVRDKDADNGLVWLSPASANNTWAMSVRQDLAEEHDLVTLDDLADYLADGGRFKFAASAEFVASEQALPAFQQAYGFTLSEDQLLVLSGGNTAATMRAAARQTSGVNAAMTYGTDGGLAALGLTVLEDTRNVQPVYQPAPVAREWVLDAYPDVVPALETVFDTLDVTTLQRLNAEVAVNGRAAGRVASDYLDDLGR